MPDSLLIAYRDFGWGGVRPYLVLHVTGINGASGLLPGLLDTGADSTVLPAGYAPLMGYTATDLETMQGTQVGGSVTLKNAKSPSKAYVPEIPDLVFDIRPCFVQGCQNALWGRADLLKNFDVTIMERKQQFLLTR
jgi:Retroviral aspartyl protease